MAYQALSWPRLHNIRDARRLLSPIAVNMSLHSSGDLFEVNIFYLMVSETLRVFKPNLHEALSEKSRYS